MTVDLTKLVMHSDYSLFKNNTIYTGTKTISGTTTAGTNTKTFDVTLSTAPDLLDIIFSGDGGTTWFKQGSVSVPTDNAGGGNPSSWRLTSSINGTTLTLRATYVQQFVTAEVLTATNFSYRVMDYSVF